ncbi:tyrosine-type recombinase/integrase [Paraburkholderia sp. 40]|uniref:tyrosine-type recombinase/integrase n=1 Tax=Paraburkholderia sp. 40 TaxID=2991059 RepID=UPI003D1E322D
MAASQSRQLHRLSALRIAKLVDPGYYADGGGLYFQISSSGARSWVYQFKLFGRSREMGLGPALTVSLAEARSEAARCRALAKDKIDPIEARKEAQRKAAAEEAMPFRDAAAAYVEKMSPSWKNRKHAQQWTNTLTTYAYPVIGDVDVRHVDTPMVVRILQPIWSTKRETANRVRGRIENILDAEKVLGHRDGDNPARWRGHLDKVLAKRKRAVNHFPALPWADIPEFMRKLEAKEEEGSRSAVMLHLLILTVCRTNEIRGARPEEFDLRHKIWTIPGGRMKMGVPHRIPLCDKAFELAKNAMATARYGYLFPGDKKGSPLSNMAMLELLDGMGYSEITVHGFRSTFQDWAEEYGEYPELLTDKAIAHKTTNKARRAYQRGDMLERRRKMMDHWSLYCGGMSATVVPIAPVQAVA